jgi:hypothetical protein
MLHLQSYSRSQRPCKNMGCKGILEVPNLKEATNGR